MKYLRTMIYSTATTIITILTMKTMTTSKENSSMMENRANLLIEKIL